MFLVYKTVNEKSKIGLRLRSRLLGNGSLFFVKASFFYTNKKKRLSNSTASVLIFIFFFELWPAYGFVIHPFRTYLNGSYRIVIQPDIDIFFLKNV